MRRALVIAVLAAWLTVARADRVIHIERTDLTIELPGTCKLESRDADIESWICVDFDSMAAAQFTFSAPVECGTDGESRSLVKDAMTDSGRRHRVECLRTATASYLIAYLYSDDVPESFLSSVVSIYEDALWRRDGGSGGVPEDRSPTVESEPSDGWDTGPQVVHERGLLRWLRPHTIAGGLVNRAADELSAWGAGAALTRRPWHGKRHLAVGYEATVTAASGWWSGSAQLRPGVWIGSDARDRLEDRRGLGWTPTWRSASTPPQASARRRPASRPRWAPDSMSPC